MVKDSNTSSINGLDRLNRSFRETTIKHTIDRLFHYGILQSDSHLLNTPHFLKSPILASIWSLFIGYVFINAWTF